MVSIIIIQQNCIVSDAKQLYITCKKAHTVCKLFIYFIHIGNKQHLFMSTKNIIYFQSILLYFQSCVSGGFK